MKKSKIVWIIIAVSLIVLGALISTVSLAEMSFDFNNLNTQKYISNEHIFAEDFTNIKIDVDTSNIEFVRSENNDCMIVSIDTEKTRHIITVENGTLMISLEDSRKWYDYIGVFTMSPSLTIHLPKDSYDLLNIEASTSDIVIQKDFIFGNVDIETDTGDIQLLSQVSDTLDITTDTGDVKIQDITAQNITLETDTGETYLTNVNCNSLVSNGNTGDIKLTNTIAANDFNITRSTGDIRFVACDAGEILITTDTGDVSGTLLTDKVFICKTDTGDIDVPKTTDGGKCEITTDTGDIYFREVG